MSSMADGPPSATPPNDEINNFARQAAVAAEKTPGSGGGNGPPQSVPPAGNSINSQSRQLALEDERGVPAFVFISYSHEDGKQIRTVLKYLRALGKWVRVWYDQELEAGDLWKPEIEDSIVKAHIILLLLSENYVISEPIETWELPAIKKRIEAKTAELVPILAKPAILDRKEAFKWLLDHNIRPGPAKPIWGNRGADRDELDKIAREVGDKAEKWSRGVHHENSGAASSNNEPS